MSGHNSIRCTAITGLLLSTLGAFHCAQASERPDASTTTEHSSTSSTQTEAPANAVKLNADQLIAELKQLIDQQKFRQALSLAQQYLLEYEGDPSFDFYFGFSAAQSGRFNQAVFAFERLTSTYPQVPRYRLELARCYYHLDQIDAAEAEFRQVLALQPPAGVQQTIRGFLNAISEQRRQLEPSWGGQLSYSGGYDSNINSATSANSISVDLPDFSNPGEVIRGSYTPEDALSAGFYQLRATLNYQTPLTQRSGFIGQAGLQRKHNSKDNSYDIDSLYADGAVQFNRGRQQYQLGGRYQHIWLATDSLQHQTTAYSGWSYALSQYSQGFARFELQDTRNQQNRQLNAQQWQLSLGFNQLWSRFQWRAEALAAIDDAGRSPLARNTTGASISMQWLWKPQQQLYSLLAWRAYQFQRVDEENLLTEGKRKESLSQLVLGYNRTLTSYLRAYTQLSYQDKQSNAEVYQFDRLLIEVGLSASF